MKETSRFDLTFEREPGRNPSKVGRLAVPAVNVIRDGRFEPFLDRGPADSEGAARWFGGTFQKCSAPAVFIYRHQHPEAFLHLVLEGVVKYEVNTRGRNMRFVSRPGTIFLLPRGTIDELNWTGSTERVAMNIHSDRLTRALEVTSPKADIELTEHWKQEDKHISALLMELVSDLEDQSPAGTIYGESLANALAVYLVKRYAMWRFAPAVYKGGLPGGRLRRVLEFIASSLDENITLAQLATIAGMSPHYFSELFKRSTGSAPHTYVLTQRIERAKQRLQDPERSVIDAGLEAGFQNPSHFARVFRKLVGTTPSKYRADQLSRAEMQHVH